MNLREQFEMQMEVTVSEAPFIYAEWLEQRFKEQVEVLERIQYAIEECRLDNGGVVIGDRLESSIKEQLKKSN